MVTANFNVMAAGIRLQRSQMGVADAIDHISMKQAPPWVSADGTLSAVEALDDK